MTVENITATPLAEPLKLTDFEYANCLDAAVNYAQGLMDLCATEVVAADGKIEREYRWDSWCGRYTYAVQQLSKGTDRSQGWMEPILVLASPAGGNSEENAICQINLDRIGIEVEPGCMQPGVFGQSHDEILTTVLSELDHKLEIEDALYQIEYQATRMLIAQLALGPAPEIDTSRPENPSLQLSETTLRRLRLARQIFGQDEAPASHDGPMPNVLVPLGVDSEGRSFEIVYNHATQADLDNTDQTGHTPTGTVIVRERERVELYDLLPNGRIAVHHHNPDRAMYERQDLFARLEQLGQHMDSLVRGDQPSMSLRLRLAVLMEDHITRANQRQGHNNYVRLNAKLGAAVLGMTISESNDFYTITTTCSQRLRVPKDTEQPILGLASPEQETGMSELISYMYNLAGQSVVHQELEWTMASLPARRADEAVAKSQGSSHYQSGDLTHRRKHYTVERHGRPTRHGHFATDYVRVSTGRRAYRLTDTGFVPEHPNPKRPRREQRRAARAFRRFSAALGHTITR